MLHKPDDKSVQARCYMHEDGQNHDEHVDHINLSVPNVAPVPCPEDDGTSTVPKRKLAPKVLRIPPRRVALCGGGIRGVAHVGVMKSMRDAGLLSYVKEVIGISAGSLFALLWVLDYTVEQIETLSLDFDFTLLRSITPDTVFAFPVRYGLDEGIGIDKLITSILRQKGFPPDVTFQTLLKKHPIHLRCFATEVQSCTVREFGSVQTPNISVKFAIRASMALPFFYTPLEESGTGNLLVDGGIMCNLPLVFMKEEEVRDTICVFFSRWHTTKSHPIHNIMDMVNGVFDSVVILKSQPYMKKYIDNIIIIPTNEFHALNFEETKTQRASLIEMAYERANEFFFKGTRRPLRRFSAH